MNRADLLAAARAASATDTAPASVVTYTETELAERQAYAELAALARRWRKRAAAERVLRALEADDHEPFLLTRMPATMALQRLVKFTKTLQGLRPTVVHINTNPWSRT